MKFDLHTHHERCGHAYGTIQDYIESALEMGLSVIGIADHCPNFSHPDDHPTPRLKMPKSEFPNYVSEVLQLKEHYKDKIEILLGIESDFIPKDLKLYQRNYSKFPFDYIIGSVHGIGDVSIFAKELWKQLTHKELEQYMERYYDLIRQSAKSGCYDFLGHIDALKTYFPLSQRQYQRTIEKTLKILGECDSVIEVNTSGDKKNLDEWYPSYDILELACFYDVKVTFGSDAHRPEHLGNDLENVRKTLKSIGYHEWAIFRQRNRIMLEL